MELNWEGVVVGAASLLVIGAFHPLVIWCEYRFTQRIWPGGAWVVSQKSQKKITDCRRNVFLPCGSLFLDSRGAVLYNYPMVSNN